MQRKGSSLESAVAIAERAKNHAQKMLKRCIFPVSIVIGTMLMLAEGRFDGRR